MLALAGAAALGAGTAMGVGAFGTVSTASRVIGTIAMISLGAASCVCAALVQRVARITPPGRV